MKRHRFCLLRGFQHFESQKMTCCCSLCLLYKVHAIKLDLQSQLHQVVLFSHYSSTKLLKEQLFLVEILQPAFQGLAPSRCYPFFVLNKAIHGIIFEGLVTIITNLPPATYKASRSCYLFVSTLLDSFYSHSHCHFVF